MKSQAAYIKGLIEGLNFDENSKEFKVLTAITELLEDMCYSVEQLEEDTEIISEHIDDIHEQIEYIEEYIEDEIYDEFGCGDSCGCGCGDDCDCDDECGCGDDCDCDDDFCDFQVTCPSCGDIIELNEAVLDEGLINCPNCKELLEFDFDEIIEDDE